MLKSIGAIITGMLAGFAVVYLGDMIAHSMHTVDGNIDFKDKEAIRRMMDSIPLTVLIVMLTFWLLSSFIGGAVAGIIDRVNWKRNSLIIGCVLLAGAIANFFLIPHPVWMIAIAVAGYVPAAYFGGRISGNKA